MTAKELLRFQCDDAEYQLQQVLDGLDGSHVDGKPINTMMSLRQMVAHLAEAYHATIKDVAGEKHEWGTYEPQSSDWNALVAEFFDLRRQAVEAVLGLEDEDRAVKLGSGFIVGHDYYHVGQFAALRISADPSWDSYKIYR
ncbi:MAG: DinB family protein [Fimbriimonas sp.]